MKGKRTFERKISGCSYHVSHPKGDTYNKLKKEKKKFLASRFPHWSTGGLSKPVDGPFYIFASALF